MRVQCGREIAPDEPHEVVSRRQVFDMPEPKPEVTEHRPGQNGHKQQGAYPADQYGPGVRALVVKLSVDHKMPLEQMGRPFGDLYGYELVERALEEGYELAAPPEEETKEQLRQAHDETGLRVGGKLQWLHTASSVRYTHLFVHEKRGEQALRSASSILPEFSGWAIHDHLAA